MSSPQPWDPDSTMRKLSRSFPFSLFHRRKRIDRNAVRSSYVVAPVHVEAPTTPAGVAIRCRKCNSDLFANDLDLKSVTEFFGGISVNESWEEGAEAGCMFCRLITAVWEDAKWRYELDWSRLLKIELITDGQYLLRLMNGEAKLPHILVPMTWSTITIFVKGKAYSVDRYVLKYQHHRSQSPHPPGEI